MHRVTIIDNGHKYTCESMDKARVLSFIDWFLDNVAGEATIQLTYQQTERPIQVPVPNKAA